MRLVGGRRYAWGADDRRGTVDLAEVSERDLRAALAMWLPGVRPQRMNGGRICGGLRLSAWVRTVKSIFLFYLIFTS
jgi:hypothetical protein